MKKAAPIRLWKQWRKSCVNRALKVKSFNSENCRTAIVLVAVPVGKPAAANVFLMMILLIRLLTKPEPLTVLFSVRRFIMRIRPAACFRFWTVRFTPAARLLPSNPVLR